MIYTNDEAIQSEWESLHKRYYKITGIHLFRAEVLYILENLALGRCFCSSQEILAFQLHFGLDDGILRKYDEIAEYLEIPIRQARKCIERVSSRIHYPRVHEALEIEREIKAEKKRLRNEKAAQKRQLAMLARYPELSSKQSEQIGSLPRVLVDC